MHTNQEIAKWEKRIDLLIERKLIDFSDRPNVSDILNKRNIPSHNSTDELSVKQKLELLILLCNRENTSSRLDMRLPEIHQKKSEEDVVKTLKSDKLFSDLVHCDNFNQSLLAYSFSTLDMKETFDCRFDDLLIFIYNSNDLDEFIRKCNENTSSRISIELTRSGFILPGDEGRHRLLLLRLLIGRDKQLKFHVENIYE